MTQQIFTPDLTQIDEDARFNLGQLYIDNDGNHYRYMQADGSVTSYSPYSYTAGTWQIDAPMDLGVTPVTAGTCPLCVWDGSATAITDNYYAWVFVGPGSFTATIDGSAATAGAIVYGHATAGLISTTASALLLNGVTVPVTIAAATGTLYASTGLYAVDLA